MRKEICKKLFVAVITVMLAITAFSAGYPAEVQAASKPTLSATTKSLKVGGKVKLKVNNLPKNATVKWSSSNKKAITVSQKGVVKAIKKGKANVICKVKTAKGKTYTLKCYVNCKADYLSRNGLKVTKSGSVAKCPIYTNDYQAELKGIKGKISYVPAKITVKTTDNGNGYSDTVLTVEYDCSGLAGNTYKHWWLTAFDRYTGVNFETKKSDGVGIATGNTYQLKVNNTVYAIEYSVKDYGLINSTTLKAAITIHHPNDYDGVVFHIDGYTSAYDVINYNEPFKMLDYDGVVTKTSLFFTALNR